MASLPPIARLITTVSRLRYAGRTGRKLEIGPGNERLPSFETLNIVAGRNVDYVADAARRLPFASGTFELIYASHVLEHIPWYQTGETLREWVRLLKPGGSLEIWVPDGLKICETLVAAEHTGARDFENDGWYRYNEERDPCKWAAGRLYTYGDGTGRVDDPNWHRALFTPRFLLLLLRDAGLTEVQLLDRSGVRGFDHGWINLGATGVKPPMIARETRPTAVYPSANDTASGVPAAKV